MLQLKNAVNDPQSMSQDGDAILRSLQNKNLPMIDLLVRESLQNSLDASINKDLDTEVKFTTGNFTSEVLADNFETIGDVLKEKKPGIQEFLSISDKNTLGLTGDYKTTDPQVLEESNFHKLVFGIGKNQNKAGAGGSWGLGKTAFFRIGIGIVIYYTRIKKEGIYEERLIASLIESPKSNNRLLANNHRGIAWWGELENNIIHPKTNEFEIENFLSIFKLKKYEGNETGTTIIIPYLINDENKYFEENINYPWEKTLSSKLNMAVQRWYAPRILNDVYSKKTNNSMLKCTVNDELITPLNMEPIFQIFQILYNSALLNKPQSEKITVIRIDRPRNIMKDKKEAVGNIAFCEVSKTDLKMDAPNNKISGLAYLGMKDKDKIEKNNSKVIAYTRKPGMIVEYGIDEGEWIPYNNIQKEGNLLLAFFVPNSSGALTEKFEYNDLESYLRSTESADHAEWLDEDGVTIVKRIKSYSKQAIDEKYQDGALVEHKSKISGLSRKYGKILMPPKNFGKSSSKIKNKNTTRNERNINRTSTISVMDYKLVNQYEVEVRVTINLKKATSSDIFCQILTQDQRMNQEKWIKIIGNSIAYPFYISNAKILSVNDKMVEQLIDEYVVQDDVYIKLINTPYNQLMVENRTQYASTIEVILHLKVNSDQYVPNIAIRTNEALKESGKK